MANRKTGSTGDGKSGDTGRPAAGRAGAAGADAGAGPGAQGGAGSGRKRATGTRGPAAATARTDAAPAAEGASAPASRGAAKGAAGGAKKGAAGGAKKGAVKGEAKGATKRAGGKPDLRGDLRHFIAENPEGWGHDQWQGLLGRLGQRGHDTSNPDRIGMELERERLSSRLEGVEGVSTRHAKSLADRFGTLYSLRHAAADEIAKAAKVPRDVAERIKKHLG